MQETHRALTNLIMNFDAFGHMTLNVCIHAPLYMSTSRSFTKKKLISLNAEINFSHYASKRGNSDSPGGIILLPDSVGLS
jgi:hypothetical protein